MCLLALRPCPNSDTKGEKVKAQSIYIEEPETLKLKVSGHEGAKAVTVEIELTRSQAHDLLSDLDDQLNG